MNRDKYSSVCEQCAKCPLYKQAKCAGLIYYYRTECPDYNRKKGK